MQSTLSYRGSRRRSHRSKFKRRGSRRSKRSVRRTRSRRNSSRSKRLRYRGGEHRYRASVAAPEMEWYSLTPYWDAQNKRQTNPFRLVPYDETDSNNLSNSFKNGLVDTKVTIGGTVFEIKNVKEIPGWIRQKRLDSTNRGRPVIYREKGTNPSFYYIIDRKETLRKNSTQVPTELAMMLYHSYEAAEEALSSELLDGLKLVYHFKSGKGIKLNDTEYDFQILEIKFDAIMNGTFAEIIAKVCGVTLPEFQLQQ